jgi:hypothetical protein
MSGGPNVWIDTVEFGGLNRGIDDGGGFAATLGPHEHVVLRPMAMPRIDRSAVLLSSSRKAALNGGYGPIVHGVLDRRCSPLGDQRSGRDPFTVYHIQPCTNDDDDAKQTQRVRKILEN